MSPCPPQARDMLIGDLLKLLHRRATGEREELSAEAAVARLAA